MTAPATLTDAELDAIERDAEALIKHYSRSKPEPGTVDHVMQEAAERADERLTFLKSVANERGAPLRHTNPEIVLALVSMARGKTEAEAKARDAAELLIAAGQREAGLSEQVATLREALEPFATFPEVEARDGEKLCLSYAKHGRFAVGDFRRAARVLAATAPEPREDGR